MASYVLKMFKWDTNLLLFVQSYNLIIAQYISVLAACYAVLIF